MKRLSLCTKAETIGSIKIVAHACYLVRKEMYAKISLGLVERP